MKATKSYCSLNLCELSCSITTLLTFYLFIQVDKKLLERLLFKS